MKNEFKSFRLKRNSWSHCLITDNPRTKHHPYGTRGAFMPALSLTRPINKDGSLTKYAQILLYCYYNEYITNTQVLKNYSTTNWQTLRYSRLLMNIDGKYYLSPEGEDYCELVIARLVKNKIKID